MEATTARERSWSAIFNTHLTWGVGGFRTRRMIGNWLWLVAVLTLLLGGCAGTAEKEQVALDEPTPVLVETADAVPQAEPKSKYGNPKSYVVFGKRYYVQNSSAGHVEKGVASWYGKKFHGRRTSSGETYDMYAMTAAHKTLPLPTYARVVNLENGRSAVVKINDRGPFHGPRIIDLSYAAARKIGMVKAGTVRVEVRAIDPTRNEQGDDAFAIADAGVKESAPAPEKQVAQAARTDDAPAVEKPASAPALVAVEEAPARPKVAKEETTEGQQVAAVDDTLQASGQGQRGTYLQVGAFGDRANAEQLRQQLSQHLGESVQVRSSSGDSPLYKVHVGPLDSPHKADDLSQQLATLGLSKSHVIVE